LAGERWTNQAISEQGWDASRIGAAFMTVKQK